MIDMKHDRRQFCQNYATSGDKCGQTSVGTSVRLTVTKGQFGGTNMRCFTMDGM